MLKGDESLKHIEDNNYENMFWGYAENEKDFTDFLLSLWNKRDYEWYYDFSMRIANVFQNEESIFFDDINAEISPEMHYEDNECEYIEYPSPTETDKYTIGKKPRESEYPVVLLYDVGNDKDRVFTWVSLNEFKRSKTE